jgi:hypothetical protein
MLSSDDNLAGLFIHIRSENMGLLLGEASRNLTYGCTTAIFDGRISLYWSDNPKLDVVCRARFPCLDRYGVKSIAREDLRMRMPRPRHIFVFAVCSFALLANVVFVAVAPEFDLLIVVPVALSAAYLIYVIGQVTVLR